LLQVHLVLTRPVTGPSCPDLVMDHLILTW
jgi:hypothetical protein